ncbi:Tf2-1, partial [Ophiophagus hannah]
MWLPSTQQSPPFSPPLQGGSGPIWSPPIGRAWIKAMHDHRLQSIHDGNATRRMVYLAEILEPTNELEGVNFEIPKRRNQPPAIAATSRNMGQVRKQLQLQKVSHCRAFLESLDELPPHRPIDGVIEIVPGAKLPKPKLYSMSLREFEKLYAFIDKKLAQGFIQPARLKITALDILAHLSKGKIFPKLDLKNGGGGYYQVKIKEGDERKTAFNCPLGCFQFNMLPFGLQGAPAVGVKLDFIEGHVRVLFDLRELGRRGQGGRGQLNVTSRLFLAVTDSCSPLPVKMELGRPHSLPGLHFWPRQHPATLCQQKFTQPALHPETVADANLTNMRTGGVGMGSRRRERSTNPVVASPKTTFLLFLTQPPGWLLRGWEGVHTWGYPPQASSWAQPNGSEGTQSGQVDQLTGVFGEGALPFTKPDPWDGHASFFTPPPEWCHQRLSLKSILRVATVPCARFKDAWKTLFNESYQWHHSAGGVKKLRAVGKWGWPSSKKVVALLPKTLAHQVVNLPTLRSFAVLWLNPTARLLRVSHSCTTEDILALAHACRCAHARERNEKRGEKERNEKMMGRKKKQMRERRGERKKEKEGKKKIRNEGENEREEKEREKMRERRGERGIGREK